MTAALIGAAAGWILTALGVEFVALIGGVLFLGVVVAAGRRLRAPYLAALATVLCGYAFFTRTFAYVGYPPFFIGEAMLGAGLLVVVRCGRWRQIVGSPTVWIIALLGVWGLARTIPFLETDGLDAARDAAVYYYGAFAVIVAGCIRDEDVGRAVRLCGYWLLVFPLAVPVLYAVGRVAADAGVTLPVSGVPMVIFKPGDAGVHLAGAATLLLTGAYPRRLPSALRIVWWLAWSGAILVVGSQNRGGLVAVAGALACVAVFGSVAARQQILRIAGVSVVIVLAAVIWASASWDSAGSERLVSFQQVGANILSLSGDSGYGNLEETKDWRADWWHDIAQYTINGPYFWTGKGFGVNLATEDGYQVEEEDALRSPHSAHFTILARMGVPGLLLWAALLVTFAGSMVAGLRRTRGAGQGWRHDVTLWALSYWVAMLVNGSFDVYLEGPAGGIWFYTAIGFGIAVLAAARGERIERQYTSRCGVAAGARG